jgi:hypothetical protein
VTITLPGPPVAYAVEPARLVAWLLSHRWRECASHDPGFRSFEREGAIRSLWAGEWTPAYAELIVGGLATAEGIESHTLAALLSTPAEGPALQWAHASADTRAPVLALLDAHARDERAAATLARMADDIESAQAHEGRAMGLEAAAAVLRGGQRG